jgi:hypothetical protein
MFCSCDYWSTTVVRGVSEQFEPLHTRIHSSENDRVFVSSPFLLTIRFEIIHSESVSVLGLIDTPSLASWCWFYSMVDDIILESSLHSGAPTTLWVHIWIDSKSVQYQPLSTPQCFDIIDVGGVFIFFSAVFWHLYCDSLNIPLEVRYLRNRYRDSWYRFRYFWICYASWRIVERNHRRS